MLKIYKENFRGLTITREDSQDFLGMYLAIKKIEDSRDCYEKKIEEAV